jgi:outer membrane protein assembly factor BamB
VGCFGEKIYIYGWIIQPDEGIETIHNKKLTILLLGLLCLSMFSVFEPNAIGQQATVDWSPTFHHDHGRTGYSTSTGPLSNQNLWTYSTYNSVEYTSPAVVDGVVYVASHDHYVYALNAATGNKIWSFDAGNFVWSSPAIADSMVYFTSYDNVYALNGETGSKIWSYKPDDSIYSSPAVADGILYFSSNDGKIYALNAETGIKIWSYQTNDSVSSSPAVANGMVYIGSDDYNVYALNAETGAKIWSYLTSGSVLSSPAVFKDVIYIGSNDYYLYALNATTGAKIWSYKTGQGVESTPSIANGVVYVGSMDGNVYAFGSVTAPQTSPTVNPSASSKNQTPTICDVSLSIIVGVIILFAVICLVVVLTLKKCNSARRLHRDFFGFSLLIFCVFINETLLFTEP